MTVAELKSIIGSLAQSQGFWGRLWRDLDASNGWDTLAEEATKAGCRTKLDFILWIEC